MSKEEFYKYGESLGIKINDLQRLKILANADNEEYIFEVKWVFYICSLITVLMYNII